MQELLAQPFVENRWLKDEKTKETIYNPYNGKSIGNQYTASLEDVEKALQAAYKDKKEIGSIPSGKRAKILKAAALLLEEEKETFAKLIAEELGKPLKNTRDEVSRSIETLELSGEEAKRLHGETIPGDASERGTMAMASTYRVPVGVIAAITPFNAPLNLVCHKIGPAFAGGNVTILKPAPQTALIATALLDLMLRAGLPESAVHMLLGGVEIGQKIVQDDRVNVISFTGGTKASKNICDTAGMKKVLLELGGNAATIVHHDADIQEAAKMSAKTGNSNSGQSCISVQRIYVHRSAMNEFSEALKTNVEQLQLGDPLDAATDIGSLVDENAANRVKSWIDEAVDGGAELLTGGVQYGATITPTVLLNPKHEDKVVCEEVFGPLISVIPYDDIDEAITWANDSEFGLQTGIFTKNIDLAYKVANQIEAGGIIINGTSNFRLDHWPYGGVKNSGIGREGPRFAIEEMTEMKMVVLRLPANE
ncbi:aldehyde dehydrogenase family protein [Marinococcus sp. PL1-022]|uniref:aldehyde dehydrogenase family protein n=1 Tax=Marinococcus sp. PL1-022 TaxID=3095363 RepID=UPI0029C3B097|nr:aldehyde dehydrogenase family protein [Marinococcus sp. PL1-022]MDX6151530.1 aldehyde dehydrogenase family protein [Marinococcus sp. PL1-022]